MDKSLETIHIYELNILKEVASICDKFCLKYYLAEGTLLGAIRHHGFIPWDDDIDICMPRNDFEEFLRIAPKTLPYYLSIKSIKVECENDEDYDVFITRAIDSRYKINITFGKTFQFQRHIFIDIMPIDGFPTNRMMQAIHSMRFSIRSKLLSCSRWDSFDPMKQPVWWKRMALRVAAFLHMDRFNCKKLALWRDALLLKFPYCHSVLTMNFYSEYKKKTIFPKSYYGEGRLMPFEDTVFRVPNEAEKILEQEYGDYMTPPPVNERKLKHNIMLID